MFCLIDSALKMAVMCSYRGLTLSCQSTVSRCNITWNIYTRHIVITPHYNPIISHKPPRRFHPVYFQWIHQYSFVTLFRHHSELLPRISFTKLRMCLLFPSDLHAHSIVQFSMSFKWLQWQMQLTACENNARCTYCRTEFLRLTL